MASTQIPPSAPARARRGGDRPRAASGTSTAPRRAEWRGGEQLAGRLADVAAPVGHDHKAVEVPDRRIAIEAAADAGGAEPSPAPAPILSIARSGCSMIGSRSRWPSASQRTQSADGSSGVRGAVPGKRRRQAARSQGASRSRAASGTMRASGASGSVDGRASRPARCPSVPSDGDVHHPARLVGDPACARRRGGGGFGGRAGVDRSEARRLAHQPLDGEQ